MAKPTGLPSLCNEGRFLFCRCDRPEAALPTFFNSSLGRLRFAVALLTFYWLDLLLVSLPESSRHLPDLTLPLALLGGLPLLVYAGRTVLDHVRESASTLAYRDDLTGLGNRRAFRAGAEEALRSAKAGSLAIVLVDVDQLKKLNDGCGHAAGDELLSRTARYLVQVAGNEAGVFRFGGDEFAILLNRNQGQAAAEVMSRLGAFEARFETCGHDHRVCISYGFVSNLEHESLDSLFQRADRRLREFKHRRPPISNGARQSTAPITTGRALATAVAGDAAKISSLDDRRRGRRQG
jgi:diguanylate cyclase (GGDEF)-like protein